MKSDSHYHLLLVFMKMEMLDAGFDLQLNVEIRFPGNPTVKTGYDFSCISLVRSFQMREYRPGTFVCC